MKRIKHNDQYLLLLLEEYLDNHKFMEEAGLPYAALYSMNTRRAEIHDKILEATALDREDLYDLTNNLHLIESPRDMLHKIRRIQVGKGMRYDSLSS